MKRVIIIGGMGPQASLEVHRRLLQFASANGAINGDDFPEIVHISIPVPDFISSGSKEAGLERIKRSLNDVKFRENDRAILACNTAHVLLPEIERLYGVQFISLVDAVLEAIREENIAYAGILASPTTLKAGLYNVALSDDGVKTIEPSGKEIDVLEDAIRAVIANKPMKPIIRSLEPIIRRMGKEGAECIILGCTELSVIFGGTQRMPLIDPLNKVCKQLTKV